MVWRHSTNISTERSRYKCFSRIRRKMFVSSAIMLIFYSLMHLSLHNKAYEITHELEISQRTFNLRRRALDTRQSIGRVDNPGPLSDRWIVVLAYGEPTGDIEYFTDLPGWKVVVVGDEGNLQKFSSLNCEYLDTKKQEDLGFAVTALIPKASPSRKIIGYLFAILHGAKFIYDAELGTKFALAGLEERGAKGNMRSLFKSVLYITYNCQAESNSLRYIMTNPRKQAGENSHSAQPVDGLKGFNYKESSFRGLTYTGDALFNSYHHFGQSTLWPRGYPPSAIGKDVQRSYRSLKYHQIPVIQHSMTNGNPDCDENLHVSKESISLTFDPMAPPALLPSGVYSPLNSKNTLFHYDAFWALVLPVGFPKGSSDIWRGYWAQRLVWELGCRVVYHPPNSQRNSSLPVTSKQEKREISVFQNVGNFLEYLSAWRCPSNFSLFDCIEHLTYSLIEERFWRSEELQLVLAWISDLISIRYSEPIRGGIYTGRYDDEAMNVNNNPRILDNISHAECKKDLGDTNNTFIEQFNVIFYPAEQPTAATGRKDVPVLYKGREYLDNMKPICSQYDQFSAIESTNIDNDGIHFFDDVLLIIIFHFSSHYENIRILEATYRPIFPNMVYCGPDRVSFMKVSRKIFGSSNKKGASFIETYQRCGYLFYSCILGAIESGYHANGFLHISDDVLPKPWNMMHFNKSRLWLPKNKIVPLKRSYDKFRFWDTPLGKAAFNTVARDLETSLTPPEIKPWAEILSSVWKASGDKTKLMRGTSDVAFIPKRLLKQFEWYLPKFYARGLMVEFTLPILFFGLEPDNEIELIEELNFISVWDGRINGTRWDYYHLAPHYLHDMKFSFESNIHNLCTIAIPDFVENIYGERAIGSDNIHNP